jgi:hypothetical protein
MIKYWGQQAFHPLKAMKKLLSLKWLHCFVFLVYLFFEKSQAQYEESGVTGRHIINHCLHDSNTAHTKSD